MRNQLPTHLLLFVLPVVLLFGVTSVALAVGAYPFPQKVPQSDGSVLTIQLHGDEWFNWTSTFDGYRILKNSEGVYEYATQLKSGEFVPSGVRASDPEHRDVKELMQLQSLVKGSGVSNQRVREIRESKTSYLKSGGGGGYFGSTGNQRLLVILATFTDRQPNHSRGDIEAMMNEEGYGETGSFYDYYKEVSGGLLHVTSHVTAWVTVPNTREYYSAEGKWSEFAYQAVKQASLAGIDFSLFDNDGDGIVDGIAIIHQGPGQEVTGDEDDIWSHSFSFSSAGYSQSLRTFNGVKVDQYTVQPETRNNNGAINTIGVMCHEFGHNLGLPDYYDTNDEVGGKHDGTGRWDVMANGNYNGLPAGSCPAHHNPFSKIELGWADEVEIVEPSAMSLEPILTSQEVLRINSPAVNEYILLENRQKEGFDQQLPGHGLIAYHVDKARISSRRATNNINTEEHQGLYLLAAGGNTNVSSAPYPGSLQVTELTDYSNPAMKTWSNVPFNRSITNIFESSGVVSFDFMALQNGSPITLGTANVDANENEVFWTPSSDGYPVLLAWSDDGVFGLPDSDVAYSIGDPILGGGTVLYYGDQETSLQHEGLEPAKLYYYSIWSYLGGEWSGALTAQRGTPAEPVENFPWEDGFENGLSLWSQEILMGNYYWERAQKGIGDRPSGAVEGEKFALFSVDAFEGASTRLISPTLMLDEDKVYNLDFYHTQSPWETEQDELEVYVKKSSSEDWEELIALREREDEWVHLKYRLPCSEPVELSFVGVGKYGYGIGIDKVVVSEGLECEASFLGVSSLELIDSTETSIELLWSLPLGEKVMVVARKNNKVLELPTIGQDYSASSEFGLGDQIGEGAYVVYKGDGTGVSVTGLEHTSDYHFMFFGYNDDYCYQIDPIRRVFSTKPFFYNLSLEVTDGVVPISGAKLYIDEEPFVSDPFGMIYWVAAHDTIYKSARIVHPAYKEKWIRYNAVADSVITLSLQDLEGMLTPRNITHTKKNNIVSLSWDPVLDESFESYEPFSLTLAGWTQIDLDKRATYSIKDHSFSNQNYIGSFIVLDPHYEHLLQVEYDMMALSGKQSLAAFGAQVGANDDWLISPSFTVYEGDEVSLFACSLTDKYGFESFRVMVAEYSSSRQAGVEDFVLLGQDSAVPVEWTYYNYPLDDYVGKKIQLAIHYNSNDRFCFLLDDLRVGPSTASVLPVSPVQKSNSGSSLKRTTSGESIVSNSSKQKVQRAKGSVANVGLGYTIEMNGKEVGSIKGFHNTQFSKQASECGENILKVRADYLSFDAFSPWSQDYEVLGCYVVKFLVKNELDEVMPGVSVVFNGQELLTDEDGVVEYDGVEALIQYDYTVNIEGYLARSGQFSITSDYELVVVLGSVATDTLGLSNGEEIVVYPNPMEESKTLTITGVSEGDFNIYFYSLNGLLYNSVTRVGGGDVVVDVSSLPTGVCMVKLERGADSRTFKLVIL